MNWPFRRKKSILPSEVEDYYKAEKRDRTGIAGLLLLGTFVITFVLALAVFFGARWAYRKYIAKDSTPASPVSINEPGQSTPGVIGPADSSTGALIQGSKPAPAAPEATLSAPAPAPAPKPSTTSNKPIPNTGPADTLAIFVGVTIFGTIAHFSYSARKASNS